MVLAAGPAALVREAATLCAKLAVQGILASQSPLLTHMARGVMRQAETIWPAAKRFYRCVGNERFRHRDFGLYGMAQRAVAEHKAS